MTETPKDRAEDDSRVVNMNDYLKRTSEPMSAPGPMHPAARALQKKQEQEKK